MDFPSGETVKVRQPSSQTCKVTRTLGQMSDIGAKEVRDFPHLAAKPLPFRTVIFAAL
jgi:hypothetical protein